MAMNNNFEEYLDEIRTKLLTSEADIVEKPLNYGRQLILTKGNDKAVLCVYNGKKGYKLVWGQQVNSLSQLCQNILQQDQELKVDLSVPRVIFQDWPGFNGLWIGSDESGKGDYFGPLVVAAVCLQEQEAKALIAAGVKDCKVLTDKKVLALATIIKNIAPNHCVLTMKPQVYNSRYAEIRAQGLNLNALLANGHLNAIGGVLKLRPECQWVLIDQFTREQVLLHQLQINYPGLRTVHQQPRAEADIAVAAASVLARAGFLNCMQELAKAVGLEDLPKGAGPQVNEVAQYLIRQHGQKILGQIAKLHFANTQTLKK